MLLASCRLLSVGKFLSMAAVRLHTREGEGICGSLCRAHKALAVCCPLNCEAHFSTSSSIRE